jgi:hypothetical protein
MQDVETFIEEVAQEIDDFHPLNDFANYVYPCTHMRRYTEEEAEQRNQRLERCFDVCAKHKPDFFTYLMQLFEQVMERLAEGCTAANGSCRNAYQLDLFLSHPY